MKLLTLFLAAPVLAYVPASDAAMFSCEFKREIKLTSLIFEEPHTKLSSVSRRYIFSIDESGKGKSRYKSITTDSEDNITALAFGGGWVILEGGWEAGIPNRGDNLFIVTIFTNAMAEGKYPAILSFHAYKDIELYYPSQSFGYCE